MADMTLTTTELLGKMLWIAQAPSITDTSNLTTPEAASVVFSGPHFFTALISGVLLAFGFQLLFTNLSVAAGVSYLGRSSHSDESDDSSDSGGISIRKIGLGVGLWTLITVTIALFVACYLAVRMSLVTAPLLGATIGLVIWATYFSLLVWVSSTTIGSLVGSVVGAATSGFQAILGTASAAIGGKAAKQQVVSTAEAVAAAVRNELTSGVDPDRIRESIQDYIGRLRLPDFDISKIRGDFENLLNDPDFMALAEGDNLRHIDRQTFVDLVSRRTDFSKDEVNRLADLLEGVWRQTLGRRQRRDQTTDLVDYLKSTQPGQLKLEELNAKLDRLLAERSQSQSPASEQKPSALQQTVQTGLNTVIGMLMGRADLSDLDLQKIMDRLKIDPNKVSEQANKVVGQLKGDTQDGSAPSPIRTDVEHYLLTAPSWQMNRATIARDFRNLLYDPDADPGAIAEQVSRLNRSYFVQLLSSRGVFPQERIQEIVNQLEVIRQEVLSTAQQAKEREITADLRQRIDTYLTFTPKEQLYSEDVLPAFRALLEDQEADYETLSQRLTPYNRDALRQILLRRQDVTPVEAEAILNALDRTRDCVLTESKSLNERAKEQFLGQQQKLEDYLRNTGKSELNPEGIKRDLRLLFTDPQTGLSSLQNRASKVDRDTLVQLLAQRQDMTEAEANQIVDQVESNWNSLINSPRVLVDTVKDKYDQTLSSISDYLRATNLEELDPDGIQRDLSKLLDHPKEGTIALRQRLSRIDRETLVRLLSQREDITPEQANRTIDQVQEAIRRIVRSPRRLALRAQQQVVDFESAVEDYLRNTDKEELNPEGIKRDFALLVQSPQQGWQNLGDRLSRFDRNTIIALLSQRKDMTPEEADRIVSQIESVRDQVLDQMRQIQYRIQEVIDRIFARIRDYLNSLDRPELNYDSIKQDVRTLFDDPQAGLEALRDRLGQFDRGTLVALLSSRKDISETQANQIIDQIESARSSVLSRAERIQQEVQKRVEAVKHQAQRQMEETRKAAATAAWWLFFTALISAIASAGAGVLAA